MTQVTCTCGWVSYALTTAEAQANVDRFNAWFDFASANDRSNYGGRATIDSYRCLGCGRGDYRLAEEGDCPSGATINPVICDDLAQRHPDHAVLEAET